MIWHVIKKDFRSLWWLGPALVVAAIGYAYAFQARMGSVEWGMSPGVLFAVGWPHLVAFLSLARTVQVDGPAIARGDWHTRPISRWDILAAKALIALFAVLLPWGAIDFAWSVSWGISVLDALSGALVHMSALGAGLLLVMTIAAATRSLVVLALVIFGLISASVLIVAFGTDFYFRSVFRALIPYGSPGLAAIVVVIGCLLLAGAVFLLFHRRRVRPAFGVILAATLGMVCVGLLATVALAANWPPILSPEPPQAKGVTIAQGGPAIAREVRRQNGSRTVVSIPLKIAKPADVTLEVDRRLIERDGPGGRSIWVIGRGGQLNDNATLDGLDPEWAPAQRVSTTYRLRVRQTMPIVTLTGDEPVALPGGGTCRIIVGPDIPGNLPRTAVRCVSGKPLCLEVKRVQEHGGVFASGCAVTRAVSGRFEMGAIDLQRQKSTWLITQYRETGVIDRSFSTAWTAADSKDLWPQGPSPSPPVNAN